MGRFSTQNKQIKSHYLIVTLGLGGILLTVVSMLIQPYGVLWKTFIFNDGQDGFMDFMNHVKYCADPSETYFVSMHACFPPLSYMMYYLFSRLIPYDSITLYQAAETGPYAYLLYFLFTLLLLILLIAVMNVYLKKYSSIFKVLFQFQLILSYPFVAGILERGNSSFVVLVLLAAALRMRQSKDVRKREIALFLIAIAAGFKIYPAVFGLLYIGEKRYREALRLTMYGLSFFFVPFVFFGGTRGIRKFFLNQLLIQSTEYSSFTVPSILSRLPWLEANPALLGLVYGILLTAMIALALKTREYYVRIGLLVSIITLFPKWSGNYTMAYFLLPLLVYLSDTVEYTILSFWMDLAFAAIFSLLAVSLKQFPLLQPMALTFFIPCIACYSIMSLLVIAAFGNIKTGRNHKCKLRR